MFGFVQANLSGLTEEQKARYSAAYCGLCHTLGERHGVHARMTLTYDLVFLSLLLSSLYEPEETGNERRCVVHPCRRRRFVRSECTDYAADMTIALTYYKLLDDWHDEHSLPARAGAGALAAACKRVAARWPEQCRAIEEGVAALSEIEETGEPQPDAAAECFGRLMGALFVYRKDRWEPQLRQLGSGLGKYIYLADAAVDYDSDCRKGSYNPLTALSASPDGMRPILTTVLGEASQAFEILPLVQDADLLKNILYSGLWVQYNRGMQEREKKHGRRSV